MSFRRNWKDVDDDDDDFFKMIAEGGDEAKGEEKGKYDDDVNDFSTGLTDGIERNRSCTNIGCLVLFWAFIGGMIYLAMLGASEGQFDKLMAPLDAEKNFCGFGKMKGYPKLLMTDYKQKNPLNILQTGVCIKECPVDQNMKFKTGVNCLDNKNAKCSHAKSSKTLNNPLDICFPLNENAFDAAEKKGFEALKEAIKQNPAGKAFEDMKASSTAMYMAFGTAFVWSIIYIYLMSLFAETLAWCCVILIQLGLFGAAAGSYFMWDGQKASIEFQKQQPDYSKLSKDEQKDIEGSAFWYLVALIVTSLLAVVFMILICCGRKSLQTAIDVIDASADYVAHNKRVIFVPNVHFIITVIVVCIWLFAFLNVCSLNEIKPGLLPQTKDLVWKEKKYKYYALFMIFGFLWITAFVEYASRMVVIVGACTYYFNNHRERSEEEASAEIMYGFKCAYFYHQGSIAFGAFIIAVVRFIKLIFYYLAKKAEKASGENPAVKAAVACAACVLNCIEKICDYLNESAFCYMAITGKSFLSSAWNGFLLNLKHGLKFAFANMIAKVFIFLGKVGIVVANCFTLYFFMKFRGDLEEVSSIWGPIAVVGIVTYICGSLFLSLFEEAVMALCTCVCVDMDMNHGEPKFGPATFHDDYLAKLDKEGVA